MPDLQKVSKNFVKFDKKLTLIAPFILFYYFWPFIFNWWVIVRRYTLKSLSVRLPHQKLRQWLGFSKKSNGNFRQPGVTK